MNSNYAKYFFQKTSLDEEPTSYLYSPYSTTSNPTNHENLHTSIHQSLSGHTMPDRYMLRRKIDTTV